MVTFEQELKDSLEQGLSVCVKASEMDTIIIEGGKCLQGEVYISGAKNAALLLMAATLLAKGCSILENVPQVQDIFTMRSLLQELGCEIEQNGNQFSITTPSSIKAINTDLAKTIRGSVVLLGPLLARYKRAKISLPGGCNIGSRPIDQHKKALELLGAQVNITDGYVEASTERLIGTHITFDMPTVTGTVNGITAAVLAEGETILTNAACDPEIADLAKFLTAMGAKIEGAGSTQVYIQGVDTLHAATYHVMPDRIEAGTFMVAAAITGGNLLLKNVGLDHFDVILATLHSANVEVVKENGSFRIRGNGTMHPLNITTAPYPGFPTDLQSQFMVLATFADGQSTIHERIFEKRFKLVPELNRMGASITCKGQTATIKGSTVLTGKSVRSTDLRAGAALVLAGLAASGTTVISHVRHIDRGYEQLENKLAQVGAVIQRDCLGKTRYPHCAKNACYKHCSINGI